MSESLIEKINRLDRESFDDPTKTFYNLKSMVEELEFKEEMSAQDKEEIKKVIQSTNDVDVIAAAIKAKSGKNEEFDYDNDNIDDLVDKYADDTLNECSDFCCDVTDEKIKQLSDACEQEGIDPFTVAFADVDILINPDNTYRDKLINDCKYVGGNLSIYDALKDLNDCDFSDCDKNYWDIDEEHRKRDAQHYTNVMNKLHGFVEPTLEDYNADDDFDDITRDDIWDRYIETDTYEDDDWSHANLYGGDLSYCPICGSSFEWTEDGDKYCPQCDESSYELAQKARQMRKNESLNEAIDISTYQELQHGISDGGIYYDLFRKLENGKGKWAAWETKMGERVGEPFEITYAQALGEEPINSVGKMSRYLGKKLLPKREAIENKYYALMGYEPDYEDPNNDSFYIIDVVRASNEDEANAHFKKIKSMNTGSSVTEITEKEFNDFIEYQNDIDDYEKSVGLTSDPMNAGQWYESLNERYDFDIVDDAINHFRNDLGEDPSEDDIIDYIERIYPEEVPEDAEKYQKWYHNMCAEIAPRLNESLNKERTVVKVDGKEYPIKDTSFLADKLASAKNDYGLEHVCNVRYKDGSSYKIYDSGFGNMSHKDACAVKNESLNEGIDNEPMFKFKVGDTFEHAGLYGGLFYETVISRTADTITTKEEWTAEDTGEGVSDTASYPLEQQEFEGLTTEAALLFEYKGTKGYAYPPEYRKEADKIIFGDLLLKESINISKLTHNLVLDKDYYYDSVDNLESNEELEMFTDLGFVNGTDIIVPAGTKLKYSGSSNPNGAGFLYFDVVGKGYTIAISNQEDMLNNFIDCVDVVDINESLNEKLVPPSRELINAVKEAFNKYGFEVESEGKNVFGDSIHYQIINKNATATTFDELKAVVEDLADELSELGDKFNSPITYNFGANNKDQVTAGVDVREMQVNEGLDEEDYYTDERLQSVYDITKFEAELVRKIRDNLNTEKGEKLYYELENSIIRRHGKEAILYDLAADFNWYYDWKGNPTLHESVQSLIVYNPDYPNGIDFNDLDDEEQEYTLEDIHGAGFRKSDIVSYRINSSADYFELTFKDSTKRYWFVHGQGMYIEDTNPEDPESYLNESLTEAAVNKYKIYMCDSNAAASRGTEEDHFFDFDITASNDNEAFIKAVNIQLGYDEDEWKETADYLENDLEETAQEYLNNQDPGSGENIIYGIEKNGKLIFDFSFEEWEAMKNDTMYDEDAIYDNQDELTYDEGFKYVEDHGISLTGSNLKDFKQIAKYGFDTSDLDYFIMKHTQNESLTEDLYDYESISYNDYIAEIFDGYDGSGIDAEIKLLNKYARALHTKAEKMYAIIIAGDDIYDYCPEYINNSTDIHPVISVAEATLYEAANIQVVQDNVDPYQSVLWFKNNQDAEKYLSYIRELPVEEALKEDYNQSDDEWGEPYTRYEVERDLSDLTKRFTTKEGIVKCLYEQECQYGLEVLKKYYEKVDSKIENTGKRVIWKITYSKPIDQKKESIKEGKKSAMKFRLKEDSLAPTLRNRVKQDYKQWDRRQDEIKRKRKELSDLFDETEKSTGTKFNSELKAKSLDDFGGKLGKFNKDYSRKGNLETKEFPFYVTYYAEYPIYEPAEGGYYYAGAEATWSQGFNTKEEAQEALRQLANEEELTLENPDYAVHHSKYVGDEDHAIVETSKNYLSGEHGWEPYQ